MNKQEFKEFFIWLKPYIYYISTFVMVFILTAIIFDQQERIKGLKQIIDIKSEFIYNTEADSSFVYKIQKENDSLKTECFIANYKLAKIKEYNKLGKKGNNFRFLPGWIDRALDNHSDF